VHKKCGYHPAEKRNDNLGKKEELFPAQSAGAKNFLDRIKVPPGEEGTPIKEGSP
jgi:hypothetical protein